MRKLMFCLLTVVSLSLISCGDDDDKPSKTYNPEDFDMYHMVVAMGLKLNTDLESDIVMSKSFNGFTVFYTFYKIDYVGFREMRQYLLIEKVIDGTRHSYYTEKCKKTANGYEIPLVKYTDVEYSGWVEGYFNSLDDFWFHCGDPEVEITPDDI